MMSDFPDVRRDVFDERKNDWVDFEHWGTPLREHPAPTRACRGRVEGAPALRKLLLGGSTPPPEAALTRTSPPARPCARAKPLDTAEHARTIKNPERAISPFPFSPSHFPLPISSFLFPFSSPFAFAATQKSDE